MKQFDAHDLRVKFVRDALHWRAELKIKPAIGDWLMGRYSEAIANLEWLRGDAGRV